MPQVTSGTEFLLPGSPQINLAPHIDLAEARVLVVEDNEFNRQFACAVLGSMGLHLVECAPNGVEGLAKVVTFQPDLVLLDLMMPVMDGQEFLRRLRAIPDYHDLPVLVTTAMDTQEVRNATFALGAADYIDKPINRQELVARVSVHLRSHLLLKRLGKYHARLAHDLQTAQAMQEALLPTAAYLRETTARYGLFVDALFAPSAELGGDFWGLLPVDDHRLALFAVDFSGHGVAAAINTFRLHLLIQAASSHAGDPAAFLQALNQALLPLLPRGQFATMIMAVIDVQSGTLTMANAGGPAPVIGIGGATRRAATSHLPLGIAAGASYTNQVLGFPRGSHVSLYSDGFSEMTDQSGQYLGEAGIEALVAECIDGPPSEMLKRVMDGFARKVPGRPEDDLSFIWVASLSG
ncbi:MAG: fused response regulator/phosphatase [Rhodospirillaceae bacterium]|nr:fused response regulator/phosphatase [Rhodospirillales bacterium]